MVAAISSGSGQARRFYCSSFIYFPEKTETSFNQDLLVNALEAEEPGLYDNPKATNQSPTTNGSLDPFDMGKLYSCHFFWKWSEL